MNEAEIIRETVRERERELKRFQSGINKVVVKGGKIARSKSQNQKNERERVCAFVCVCMCESE